MPLANKTSLYPGMRAIPLHASAVPWRLPASAWLMYADDDLEGQDEWNEMRLNNQRTRYSVHIDQEH